MSTCNPYSVQLVPYRHACTVPAVSSHNTTNNTALLQGCCPTGQIADYGVCSVYCNATSQPQAQGMD